MICGFDHVVIAVFDMEAAIRTWRDGLGLPLSHRASHPEAHLEAAFFRLEQGGFIELVAPLSDRSPIHKFLDDKGEGMRVLCLHVDDLDAAIADLTRKGIALDGVGTRWVFVRPEAASGVLLQLWPRNRPHRWRDGDIEQLANGD
jgi:methylmalonyl-CoA/ethylmalonyl-CoA epimerase